MPPPSKNTRHSFSLAQTIICPSCGQEFAAKLWLIVDADERPDLVERIRAGQLHELPCPHCGEAAEIDAPLLVYMPAAAPPLLFSPANQTSDEQHHEDAVQLAGILRQSLGNAWQDQWVTEGIPGAVGHLLPGLLSGSPDRAMQDRGGGFSVPVELRGDLQQAQGNLQQYLRNGSLTALDAAAAACSRILEYLHFTTSDVRFQLATCHGAAHVFTCRFNAHGDVADLDRALGLCRYAVEHAPADSPKLPTCWNNLGNVLRTCYGRTGRLEEMEEAIQAFQKAVERTPPDSGELPRHLNNLGTGLLDRHHQTGQLQDIEKAIRVFRQAIACTPQSSPDLPRHRSNLGSALSERYERSGPLENLEEAIEICQQAVSLAPPGSPELPLYLTNLANVLLSRYRRTDRLENLDETIRVSQQAVASMPPDSPKWPGLVTNLATGLHDRFSRTGRLEDLDEAIGICRQAITRSRSDAPDLLSRLNNLGVGLRDRYGRTGQLEDLEEAIQAWQRAIAGTPPDAPNLPGFRNNLATGLFAIFTPRVLPRVRHVGSKISS